MSGAGTGLCLGGGVGVSGGGGGGAGSATGSLSDVSLVALVGAWGDMSSFEVFSPPLRNSP